MWYIVILIIIIYLFIYFIIESYRKYTNKKHNKAPYTRPSLCTGNK